VNGAIYKTKDMSGLAGGDYRTGKVFSTSEVLSESGTYEYRFKFADAEGKAHGDPNNWQTGPVITGPTCAVVTSLAGVPTNAGVQVTFSLSSTAEVTATVLNLAGRPIKTIAADQPLAAGLQTLAWDGKAANGLTAPAGLYVVRVTARNAEGGQSTALATVALR